MINGANVIGAMVAFLCVAFMGVAFWLRAQRLRRTKAYFQEIYSTRDELPREALSAAFASSGIAPEDALLILGGAAEYMAVSPGKLRPSDSFAKELCPPSLVSPNNLAVQTIALFAVRNLRAKYPGFSPTSAEVHTLGELVAALARDIARQREKS